LGPQFFSTSHAVLVDVELRIVDAAVEVLDVLEHHRAALVLEQRGRCRRGLDDGAVGRQVAAQHLDAGVLLERLLEGVDDVAVPALRVLVVFPDGLAVHRQESLFSKLFSPSSRRTAGSPPA
jgi:hypothetical protein